MRQSVKYVHTNIIAKNWRALADFYIQVFDCKLSPPERDLSGVWIDDLTGISGVRVRGVHLSLPGYENGPTLEIFEYSPEADTVSINGIDQKGFGHIAFLVDCVEEKLQEVLEHGGSQLGKVVRKEYESLGTLTAVYAADPEGNFIEIQNWKK